MTASFRVIRLSDGAVLSAILFSGGNFPCLSFDKVSSRLEKFALQFTKVNLD